MRNIRCSSLDDLFACGPSVLDEGSIRVNPNRDEQQLGKVVHRLAGEYVETGKFDARGECNRQGVAPADESKVADLMDYVVRTWEDVRRFFGEGGASSERAIASEDVVVGDSTFVVTGTLDAVHADPDRKVAIFLDWKTGRLDDGYVNQMFGYAWLLWVKLGRPDDAKIIGFVVFLLHRYYRTVVYTPEKLREWERDLLHNVLGGRGPNTYRPGSNCRNCQIRTSCPAYKQVVSSTVDALAAPRSLPQDHPQVRIIERAKAMLAGITAENKNEPEIADVLSNLVHRCRLGQQAIDDVKQLVRDAVERVGPIRTAADLELTLRRVDRKHVDAARAIRVLRKHFSDAEVLACCDVSLPQLQQLKSAKYNRGEKHAARKQLEQELDAAGALSVRSHQRLEEVDVSIPDGEPQDEQRIREDSRTGKGGPGALPGDGAVGEQRPVE